MSGIEIEGFEEFEKFLGDMVLTTAVKRKAVRTGIKVIANGLEEDTPIGPTNKLAEIKVSVKENNLAIEGLARSNAFYDIFQNFGTSEQKAHIGYFDRSVDENKNDALEKLANIIFEKMR